MRHVMAASRHLQQSYMYNDAVNLLERLYALTPHLPQGCPRMTAVQFYILYTLFGAYRIAYIDEPPGPRKEYMQDGFVRMRVEGLKLAATFEPTAVECGQVALLESFQAMEESNNFDPRTDDPQPLRDRVQALCDKIKASSLSPLVLGEMLLTLQHLSRTLNEYATFGVFIYEQVVHLLQTPPTALTQEDAVAPINVFPFVLVNLLAVSSVLGRLDIFKHIHKLTIEWADGAREQPLPLNLEPLLTANYMRTGPLLSASYYQDLTVPLPDDFVPRLQDAEQHGLAHNVNHAVLRRWRVVMKEAALLCASPTPADHEPRLISLIVRRRRRR